MQSTSIQGYRKIWKNAQEQIERCSGSIESEDQVDRLLLAQQDIINVLSKTTAHETSDILAKFEIWLEDQGFTTSIESAETASDKLVISILSDLQKYMSQNVSARPQMAS